MRVYFSISVLLSCLCVGAPAQSLVGDLNRDCKVDFNDLQSLSRSWLRSDPNLDPNHDARMNLVDLALLANHWRQRQCPIVINELLAHSHDTAPDWIELHNVSSVRVHIGGWSLSQSPTDLNRYEIPQGTIVEPNGYIVFYEDLHFGNPLAPGVRHPFRLSENGDSVYLYSGGDPVYPRCLESETFGASETWVTFGRHFTRAGTRVFTALSRATPGAANAYPLVGPIVISEIMYHPGADSDAEYIELLNMSDAPVTLRDPVSLLPWRLTTDSGIDFALPADPPVTLQPREHLLLAKDLARVRRYYTVPADVQTFPWGAGKLTNSGATISLWKPGDVDTTGTRYWIQADRVAFSDGAHGKNFATGVDPWPPGPDGAGLSLNRHTLQYGDDPCSWEPGVPTPGTAND